MMKSRSGKGLTQSSSPIPLRGSGTLESTVSYQREGFFMAFKDGLQMLVLERGLTAGEMKVLFHMGSRMNYYNVCEASVTDIVNAVFLSRSVGSRAIRRLLELQIIYPVATSGPATFYMVSPYIFAQVKASEHEILCRKWDNFFKDSKPPLELVGQQALLKNRSAKKKSPTSQQKPDTA